MTHGIRVFLPPAPAHQWLEKPAPPAWIRRVASWAELHACLRADTACVVAIDLSLGGELRIDDVRRLRSDFPSLRIVALGHFGRHRHQDLVDLGRLGIVGAIDLAECSSLERVRALVETLSAESDVELFIAACRIVENDALADLLRVFLRCPGAFPTLPLLARAYGRHPKTLRLHVHEASLPSPERLMTWMRLFVAARLLQDPGRSTRAVADACGFETDLRFRATVRRYLGHGTSVLRAPGGSRRILDRFDQDRAAPLPDAQRVFA
jgi:AraC-like DNA-binding protein